MPQKNEKTKILFPFAQNDYGYETEVIIQRIKKQPDAVVVVSAQGELTRAFDEAGVSYYILPIKKTISTRRFYPLALARLMRISFPLFRFTRLQGGFKAAVFHDLPTALCWSGTTKMCRIPFVVSLPLPESFSKFATIVLSDALFLLCPCPFIKESTPGRFHDKMFVVPPVPSQGNFSENKQYKSRKALLKENKFQKDALLVLSDAQSDAERAKALTVAKAVGAGVKRKAEVFFTSNFPTNEDLTDVLSGCDLFLGVKPFDFDPFVLFKAMRLNIPVFAERKGIYMDVLEDGISGVFLNDAADGDENGAQIADFLTQADCVDALKKSAALQVERIYQKTLDFMKELYDSIKND